MVADGHRQSQQGPRLWQILDRETLYHSHRSIPSLGHARLLDLPYQRFGYYNERGPDLYRPSGAGHGISLREKQDRHGRNAGRGNRNSNSPALSRRRCQEAVKITCCACGRTFALAVYLCLATTLPSFLGNDFAREFLRAKILKIDG